MQTQYVEQAGRRAATRSAGRPIVSFRWLTPLGKRLDRWFLGGSTPRAAKKREFPEVEFHQVLSGKKDYLDPLR